MAHCAEYSGCGIDLSILAKTPCNKVESSAVQVWLFGGKNSKVREETFSCVIKSHLILGKFPPI